MPVVEKKFDYESEIWAVANLVWGPIKTSEFNKVILPFTMLRRLECALEPTRNDVIKAFEEHKVEWGLLNDKYCQFSKRAFYNTTNFRLNSLGSDHTLDSLNKYINGFSENACEIMHKFKMEETCKTLDEHGLLYDVCRRFSAFDLSPETVSDREMSDIYEHLIQRFGESIAENAEDFMTPKDIVRLAVGMVFAGDDELMTSDTGIVRTLYDPTLGTGGFVSDALDQIDEWHANSEMKAPAVIVPYGQEIEPESWAMAKAAMLLRNVCDDSSDIYDSIKDLSRHIAYGNTLTDDKFEDTKFNYILSNPPYGKSWGPESSAVREEHALGFAGRFGAGLPSVDDGSMLFLQHVANKLKPANEGGGKAGIVLSASPLFTGDAGSGPSNIRRWLFEKDLIDCIVKLPETAFFRTGINTYLWILSTKKPASRKGYIQLIDATGMRTPLKKSQGNKRLEISPEHRSTIISMYVDGTKNDISVMVPVHDFMYRKITTQQPLRALLIPTAENIGAMLASKPLAKLTSENTQILRESLEELEGANFITYEGAESIMQAIRDTMNRPNVSVSVLVKAMRDFMMVKDKSYPLAHNSNGHIIADSALKDTENVPYEMDLDEYMRQEVLPYAPEAWVDESVTDVGPLHDGKVGIVGTNISFSRFFYRYEEPRNPEDIAKDIAALETNLTSFVREYIKLANSQSSSDDSHKQMKYSGDIWMRDIPGTWECIPTKRRISITNGAEPHSAGDIPVFGSGQEVVKTCGEYKEGPAVLLGRKGTLDKPRYIDGKYWNVDTAFDARPIDEQYLCKFYYYYSKIFDISLYATSTALPSMKQSDYLSIKIPDIPVAEQSDIIDYLDKKHEEIDNAIARHKDIIDKLEEYRKSIIYNAVTGKIDCRKEQ